jgi:hypothetical protein
MLHNFSIVKGLFNRVARQDQWDWFTVSSQLGHPSLGTARRIAEELYRTRAAIVAQSEYDFSVARWSVTTLPTIRCLRVFLGELQIADEPGAGWVYILSTREMRDFLKIGMTARTVERRVSEINSATGVVIPFAVRRCWRVIDPNSAEKLVHSALGSYRVRFDREFFNVDFATATSIVEDTLTKANLVIRTLDVLGALKEDE